MSLISGSRLIFGATNDVGSIGGEKHCRLRNVVGLEPPTSVAARTSKLLVERDAGPDDQLRTGPTVFPGTSDIAVTFAISETNDTPVRSAIRLLEIPLFFIQPKSFAPVLR